MEIVLKIYDDRPEPLHSKVIKGRQKTKRRNGEIQRSGKRHLNGVKRLIQAMKTIRTKT